MPGALEAGTGSGLLVIGTSHRTSPLDLRVRFELVENELPMALAALKSAGAREAVLVATCDRIELVSHDDAAIAQFVPVVARRTASAAGEIGAGLYRHAGADALRHLFAVASTLDSQVIGEPQMLGQMKAAHQAASELGLVGPALESDFAAAFACARRIRRETRIAEGPVSLAAAALDLARGIHGDLDRCAALLLGPSEMGELMAERFLAAGLDRLVLCGPADRALRAARRFSVNHVPFEDLDGALAAADIVIATLGSGRAVLDRTRVAAALRRRPQRPIFVIDAAIPGDAEPAINALDGVFLYDLADLERVAMAGRATRMEAAAAAWRIVDEELAAFRTRQAQRGAVPAVVALRRHFEEMRAEVMAERGLDADAATRRLVNRLLHDPSAALRDLAGAGDAAAMENLLRRLFRLDGKEERK